MAITDGDMIKGLLNRPTLDTDTTNRAIAAGDSEIYALTGRSDWTLADDPLIYGKLQMIGALWGAYTVAIAWEKEEYLDKAKELRASYNDEVEKFRKIPLPDKDVNPEFEIEESEYTVPPLNPATPHFMSEY